MRSLSTKRNLLTKGNAKKVFFRALPFFMFAFFVFMNSVCPAFADTAYKSDVSKLAKSVVDIVGYIFRVVGIIRLKSLNQCSDSIHSHNNPNNTENIPNNIKSLDLTSYITK